MGRATYRYVAVYVAEFVTLPFFASWNTDMSKFMSSERKSFHYHLLYVDHTEEQEFNDRQAEI